MSSGRADSAAGVRWIDVVRGGTFRRVLLALLALWALLGGALTGFEQRIPEAGEIGGSGDVELWNPEIEEVYWEWMDESEEVALEEIVGEDFLDEALELEIDEDLPADEYLEEYVAALEEFLEEEDLDENERFALAARLAFLDVESEEFPEILDDPTAAAYIGLMFEEIPEHLHDDYEGIADAGEAWDEFQELLTERRGEDLRERLAESMNRESDAMQVDESGTSLRTWRNVLLPFGLLFVFAASYLAARPTAHYLHRLKQAEARLARGDFSTRLRAPASGDFRVATDATNAMLGQLEQSVAGLAQVTDDIAHDLRTPLTRLQGQLDLLKQAPSAELIEAVQSEVDQLIATFNALLRIAQVESGSRRSGFRDFDMAKVVTDVAELYEPVFAEKEQKFIVLSTGSFTFRGDRDLWMQALSNLLDNALKYTPEGGAVELRWDASSRRLVLHDSGPGIPESELENVFQRFYRLQRHRGERGNGLGLSLVKAICDLHRAKIELASENGLCVSISWPSEV